MITIQTSYLDGSGFTGIKTLLLSSRMKSGDLVYAIESTVVRYIVALNAELQGNIRLQATSGAPDEATFLSDFPNARKVQIIS